MIQTLVDVYNWLLAHPQLAITLLGALAGTGEAARRYRRTGQVPLATLPWRLYRRVFYRLRERFFTVPRPATPSFTPEGFALEDIQERIGQESFEPGWPLSFHYHDEDLNARRYYLDPTAEYPHRQIHVRGFELDDGSVELIAHDEPAPKHHPKAHLREVDLHDATQWLEDQWTSPALDPRKFNRNPSDDSES